MFSLIAECRFWTASADIKIKPTDFGAFRFHDKREQEAISTASADDLSSSHPSSSPTTTISTKVYADAKRDYSESRGHKVVLDNKRPHKRPHKLKDAIRRLEENIAEHPVVYSQWRDNSILRLMLSNGLLVHICLNVLSGAVARISYDKYFVGKITTDAITDVLITKQHIVIAYNQNQITFVYLQKPSLKQQQQQHHRPSAAVLPEKISRMEPKIFHIIIGGPSSTQGRRLSRRIACNSSFDLIAVWTRSSQNEVYPWRPTVRDQDRANVHVYKLSRSKLEPVCFHWTENDPLSVDFVRTQQNQVRIVEQRVTRKGEVFVEDQVYELVVQRGVRGLQRQGVTSIPLQSQVCCQSYSPDQEKLMLGCIDGSVCLFDAQRAVTHMVRAGFIPTLLSWHCDSALILVGNERGQLQFFDVSLACVKAQLSSEDITPSNLIDLSPYFAHQPTMQEAMFNRKPELVLNSERSAQTDSFLFLGFEGGPIGMLRITGGCGLRGDIHTSGFTVDVLIHNYLSGGQVERAINLLLCLNWDVYGAMCLISLHKIVNFIFRLPLTPEREALLQKALGSFHAPVKPLLVDTEAEFGEQVNDIMRKFFQHLLRYRAFEKAFALGIDINDEDLFVDLYNAARLEKNEELAGDALKKAKEILRHQDDNQSICSHSSCSYCGSVPSESDSDGGRERSDGEAEEAVIADEEGDDDGTGNTKRPDIVECSSSSNERQSPVRLGGHGLPHPPLPKTTYREPCYIPPLPLPSGSSSLANIIRQQQQQTTTTTAVKRATFAGHQRMFVPKPQLTVSHHKSMRQRNAALLSEQQNQPPPPTMPNFSSGNYDRSLNELDLDDFAYDYVPRTASKRVLNVKELEDHQQQQLRRDMVIDVFPKPGTSKRGSEVTFIDQTLGIPMVSADVPGVMKTSLPRHPMMNPLVNPSMVSQYQQHLQKTEQHSQHHRPQQVVHQYPLISGQIPAVANGGGAGDQPLFNMISAQPRPFHEGPPVVQPSAMGGASNGGGGGTSSNSSKSSGEKHKVKFSETITVAVLPELPRKEKAMKGARGGGGGGGLSGVPPSSGSRKRIMYGTDPKRELRDSLPLCHPNEDYLKDFQPANSEGDPQQANEQGDDEERRRAPGTIKVIHFGVV